MTDKDNVFLKEKILGHLEGLNALERQKGSEAVIKTIAERYDVPEIMVKKVIAEWEAGKF